MPFRVTYPNGDLVEYFVALFECESISGALKAVDGESADLIYFLPEEIPPLGTEYPRHLFAQDS